MKDAFKQIKKEFKAAIKEVHDLTGLEALEQRFFSRKTGEFSVLMKGMKDLSDDMRKEIGMLANAAKGEIDELLFGKRQELEEARMAKIAESEAIDVTQEVASKEPSGHLHPMSIVEHELEDLFQSMGFMVLRGPELESDFYNFEGLNIPKFHPARDSQDTFFIKDHPEWVMRTHTSPVQVRAMRKFGAPLKAVVPGRCFRNEATDGSHEHTFYQLEGLLVDKNISIADLIGVMKELLKEMLGKDVPVRLRPGYFPFVEPGFELDMQCQVCGGDGCGACKHSGWVEMIPCGLVHPEVIKHGGLDPNEYSGFAFGLGSMRLAMQRYGIEDIRHFMSGDLRFLSQF